jgi:hypothetical protein
MFLYVCYFTLITCANIILIINQYNFEQYKQNKLSLLNSIFIIESYEIN